MAKSKKPAPVASKPPVKLNTSGKKGMMKMGGKKKG